MRTVAIVALLLNLALAVALVALWQHHRSWHRKLGLDATGWLHQPAVDAFARIPSEPGCTVVAGDSLTAQGPWGELLGDVLNRGVKGDRVDGVARRLDEIIDRSPGRLFLLIGVNDLVGGSDPGAVAAGIERIVERVEANAAATELYVVSLLPVRPGTAVPDASALSEKIRRVNGLLDAMCASRRTTFIDVHSQLADTDGLLRPEMTHDGLHLTAEGYLTWRDVLRAQQTR